MVTAEMSWPPTTRSVKSGSPADANGSRAVTQPVGGAWPPAIAASPTVAVVATEPRAPTNQIPVRSACWRAEASCIVVLPGPTSSSRATYPDLCRLANKSSGLLAQSENPDTAPGGGSAERDLGVAGGHRVERGQDRVEVRRPGQGGRRHVLLQVRDVGGAGDEQRARRVPQQPRQPHLRRRDAQRGARGEHGRLVGHL